MTTIYKIFIKYIIILLILHMPSFAMEIKSPCHAIDVAGKQRMFTQRMVKDYSMIGMNNSFSNPIEDLKKIVERFEKHLQALYDYTNNNSIKESISTTKKMWLPIKKVLVSKPQKKLVKKLQDDLEKLLEISDQTTKLFAKDTTKSSGTIVDISGRQRMLSQRMASLYMLKVWNVDDDKFLEKLTSTMNLFKDSLEILKKSKLTNNETMELLSRVEKSFMFFEVMNKSSTKFIPTLIYKKSDDILKNMNAITKQYVVADKK